MKVIGNKLLCLSNLRLYIGLEFCATFTLSFTCHAVRLLIPMSETGQYLPGLFLVAFKEMDKMM
jgi:hypothetical protein